MTGKFSNTEEFRDELLEFIGSTRGAIEQQSVQLTRIEERLTTGEACVAGARHGEAIRNLEARQTDQGRCLERLKSPGKKAALWGGGIAVSGTTVLMILDWIWKKLCQ